MRNPVSNTPAIPRIIRDNSPDALCKREVEPNAYSIPPARRGQPHIAATAAAAVRAKSGRCGRQAPAATTRAQASGRGVMDSGESEQEPGRVSDVCFFLPDDDDSLPLARLTAYPLVELALLQTINSASCDDLPSTPPVLMSVPLRWRIYPEQRSQSRRQPSQCASSSSAPSVGGWSSAPPFSIDSIVSGPSHPMLPVPLTAFGSSLAWSVIPACVMRKDC